MTSPSPSSPLPGALKQAGQVAGLLFFPRIQCAGRAAQSLAASLLALCASVRDYRNTGINQ